MMSEQYSHAEYLRCVLEAVHDTAQHGIPITLRQGHSMLWIRRVVILGDHEGLRAFAGCKGAAALKPCWRCVNVIAGHRALPPGHVHLGNADSALLRPQTDAGLQAVVAHLRGCTTKKALQEAEKLLGWCLSTMEKGVLGSTALKEWISLDSFYVDSMHQFYSNEWLSEPRHWFMVSNLSKSRLRPLVPAKVDANRMENSSRGTHSNGMCP